MMLSAVKRTHASVCKTSSRREAPIYVVKCAFDLFEAVSKIAIAIDSVQPPRRAQAP